MGGYIIYLNQGVVLYKSKLQLCVSLRSCEAEYVSLSECIREVIRFRNVFIELGVQVVKPIIYCDNQGATKTAESEMGTSHNRHIEIRIYFLRDHVKNKTVMLSIYRQGKIKLMSSTSLWDACCF